MTCATHNQEAMAICPYCGRALCGSCERIPSAGRTACSVSCADALSQGERAVRLTLAKHVQGARVAAYFLYALSVVLIAVAIAGYLKEPKLIVPHVFAAASGIV